MAETFLLDQLYTENPPELHQFGGVRGVEADHLLTEMITGIMENIDDNRVCTNLISLDMLKAFNHMDHGNCITKLAENGASSQTIRMAASFLFGSRRMRIKMGPRIFSTPRDTPGGAPQGTKTGNILFCISTRGLDQWPPNKDSTHDLITPEEFFTPPTSPNNQSDGGSSLELQSIEDTELEGWRAEDIKKFKYIDDLSGLEKSKLVNASLHITTHKEVRYVRARQYEEYLERVKTKCRQDWHGPK